MLVVLGGDCLKEALTDDTQGVLATLKGACDRLALTKRMRQHHAATLFRQFRRLMPLFEKLEEELSSYRPSKLRQKPKRSKPVGVIPGLPKQHDVIFKEALAINADYLITERPAWLNLADQLPVPRIVEPAQYVAERSGHP